MTDRWIGIFGATHRGFMISPPESVSEEDKILLRDYLWLEDLQGNITRNPGYLDFEMTDEQGAILLAKARHNKEALDAANQGLIEKAKKAGAPVLVGTERMEPGEGPNGEDWKYTGTYMTPEGELIVKVRWEY